MKLFIFFLIAIATLLGAQESLETKAVEISPELQNELLYNKIRSEQKNIFRSEQGKLYLSSSFGKHPLLGIQEMESLPLYSSKSVPSFVESSLQNYIAGGAYPAQYPVATSLAVSETVSQKASSPQANLLLQSLEQYSFSSGSIRGLSRQPQNWQVNNSACLEALLLEGKKVVVFLAIAGDWSEANLARQIDVQLGFDGKPLPMVAGQAFLVVGFDHKAQEFILRHPWSEQLGRYGQIAISYDYLQTYALRAFYQTEETSEVVSNSSVHIHISDFDSGGGNFFRPDIKVRGEVSGSKKKIATIELAIIYNKKVIVILREDPIEPDEDFYLKDKYLRFGANYALIRVRDSSHKVTAYIKRRLYNRD